MWDSCQVWASQKKRTISLYLKVPLKDDENGRFMVKLIRGEGNMEYDIGS